MTAANFILCLAVLFQQQQVPQEHTHRREHEDAHTHTHSHSFSQLPSYGQFHLSLYSIDLDKTNTTTKAGTAHLGEGRSISPQSVSLLFGRQLKSFQSPFHTESPETPTGKKEEKKVHLTLWYHYLSLDSNPIFETSIGHSVRLSPWVRSDSM